MAQAAVWVDPDMTYDGRQMLTLFTVDTDRASDVIAGLIRDVGGGSGIGRAIGSLPGAPAPAALQRGWIVRRGQSAATLPRRRSI